MRSSSSVALGLVLALMTMTQSTLATHYDDDYELPPCVMHTSHIRYTQKGETYYLDAGKNAGNAVQLVSSTKDAGIFVFEICPYKQWDPSDVQCINSDPPYMFLAGSQSSYLLTDPGKEIGSFVLHEHTVELEPAPVQTAMWKFGKAVRDGSIPLSPTWIQPDGTYSPLQVYRTDATLSFAYRLANPSLYLVSVDPELKSPQLGLYTQCDGLNDIC